MKNKVAKIILILLIIIGGYFLISEFIPEKIPIKIYNFLGTIDTIGYTGGNSGLSEKTTISPDNKWLVYTGPAYANDKRDLIAVNLLNNKNYALDLSKFSGLSVYSLRKTCWTSDSKLCYVSIADPIVAISFSGDIPELIPIEINSSPLSCSDCSAKQIIGGYENFTYHSPDDKYFVESVDTCTGFCSNHSAKAYVYSGFRKKFLGFYLQSPVWTSDSQDIIFHACDNEVACGIYQVNINELFNN